MNETVWQSLKRSYQRGSGVYPPAEQIAVTTAAANQGGLSGTEFKRRISRIKLGNFRGERISPRPIAWLANERRLAHLRSIRMRQRGHVTQCASALWAGRLFQHQDILEPDR